MFYPEKFKEEVKEIYPKQEALHRLLDEGDDFLGVYLDANAPDVETVLNAILNATSLKSLKSKAKEAKKKIELYKEWCKLHQEYLKG